MDWSAASAAAPSLPPPSPPTHLSPLLPPGELISFFSTGDFKHMFGYSVVVDKTAEAGEPGACIGKIGQTSEIQFEDANECAVEFELLRSFRAPTYPTRALHCALSGTRSRLPKAPTRSACCASRLWPSSCARRIRGAATNRARWAAAQGPFPSARPPSCHESCAPVPSRTCLGAFASRLAAFGRCGGGFLYTFELVIVLRLYASV